MEVSLTVWKQSISHIMLEYGEKELVLEMQIMCALFRFIPNMMNLKIEEYNFLRRDFVLKVLFIFSTFILCR